MILPCGTHHLSLTRLKWGTPKSRKVEKQTDEKDARGLYQCLIGVPAESSDAVEYELRKAERNDDWCKWKEVQRQEKAR